MSKFISFDVYASGFERRKRNRLRIDSTDSLPQKSIALVLSSCQRGW
ncbi:hypothetical protein BRCON_0123 [Candidatus Sumerlaea chitinivorans]|uniref:Uncharacterized protein n=1 Tax=Sumerlaea chitinivorans TaxID=2250252 RepID=A0A2Z4Y1B0_SUMC1|nr:hypothetical protein BRCON_0123 [Candidatus Sumerlaea chitinivorans]